MSLMRICDKCGKRITDKFDCVHIDFEYRDDDMAISKSRMHYADYHRKCFNKMLKTDLIKNLNIKEIIHERDTVTGQENNCTTTENIPTT